MRSKSPFKQDKCTAAWAKFKEGYTKRKSKTSMRRNADGKMEKYEKPISAEDNLKQLIIVIYMKCRYL